MDTYYSVIMICHGKPEITVKYTGTIIQKISRGISAAAVLAFLAICCGLWHNRQRFSRER
jgi:hypothetical protein